MFCNYLADFRWLSPTEAASYEGEITEGEFYVKIKKVSRRKSDGLPYELYMILSQIFVPILTVRFNNWFHQGRISRVVITLWRKGKGVGRNLDNYSFRLPGDYFAIYLCTSHLLSLNILWSEN